MNMIQSLLYSLFGIALGLSLGGCPNLYDFADNPRNDEQRLSAARACLDRQDFVCATEYYAAGDDAGNHAV